MAIYDLGNVKGTGIASIEQVSNPGSNADNPITVTLDDGTQTTLHVYNGQAGNSQIGIGTCNTDVTEAITTPTLEVVLSNYENNSVDVGFTFSAVFTYDYTYDGQPNMGVNGSESKPVTIGGVTAGSGAFKAGRIYTFTYNGASFDCLCNVVKADLKDYVKEEELQYYATNEQLDTKADKTDLDNCLKKTQNKIPQLIITKDANGYAGINARADDGTNYATLQFTKDEVTLVDQNTKVWHTLLNKEDIKYKYIILPLNQFVNGKDLNAPLDSGYRFLAWIQIVSIGFIFDKPIYCVENSTRGLPYSNENFSILQGDYYIRFEYLEIKA